MKDCCDTKKDWTIQNGKTYFSVIWNVMRLAGLWQVLNIWIQVPENRYSSTKFFNIFMFIISGRMSIRVVLTPILEIRTTYQGNRYSIFCWFICHNCTCVIMELEYHAAPQYSSHRENHWSADHGQQNTRWTGKPPFIIIFKIRKIKPNSGLVQQKLKSFLGGWVLLEGNMWIVMQKWFLLEASFGLQVYIVVTRVCVCVCVYLSMQ